MGTRQIKQHYGSDIKSKIIACIGAFDNLSAIVSGNHPLSQVYDLKSDGPDGGKADMIRDMVQQYRGFAREQLKEEFPGIAAQIQTLQMDAFSAAVM